MIIERALWNGEYIKANIYLDDSTVYTVDNDSDNVNFIKSISMDLSEGNNSVNPLGISSSNSIDIEIYDSLDRLSPGNIHSPYYGKTVNGVKIELLISYNGTDYEPFGLYFATSWSGSYSEGWHGLVMISAEDILNTLGNYDLPELPAYGGISSKSLIKSVMNKLGFGDDEYIIDSKIDKTLMYGITPGTKVRDFINNICQLLFARVIIDRSGRICFVPALSTYDTFNELTIGSDYTGSFINKNSSAINYNKVGVRYLEGGDSDYGVIFRDSSHVLVAGENKISDINFRNRALSIEKVYVKFESIASNAEILSLDYVGYQNGITLNITAGADLGVCEIIGEGMVLSTTDRYVELKVDNASVIGGNAFVLDTKQMMSKSDASELVEGLKSYISTVNRNIILDGTALTPKLYIGDKLNIVDSGTMYDGEYKVVGQHLKIAEDYSMSVTLIRLSA